MMDRGRKRKTAKGEDAARKGSAPSGGTIGVLLLNAFSDYIPYMTVSDIVTFLVYESLPTEQRIAEWEVAKQLEIALKTAEKPQRKNEVQNECALIDW